MAADIDIRDQPIRAGQTLGPFTVNANAADRFCSVLVTVGTGDPAQGGGGVEVSVEGNPQGNQWREIARISFGADSTVESVSLLAGYARYRASATAGRDATISILAQRG